MRTSRAVGIGKAPWTAPGAQSWTEMSETRANIEIVPERRGSAEAVPLRAVVLLRNTDAAPPRLEPLAQPAALRDLWALSFRIPVSDDRARTFEQLADLVGRVPVYDLHRTLTFESLPEVVSEVMALCES